MADAEHNKAAAASAATDTNGGEGDSAAGAAPAEEEGELDLETMRRKVKELEEEATRMQEMNKHAEEAIGTPSSTASGGAESKDDVDGRSIYVGNVDYACTPEELQTHFKDCGTINRVTILCDKFTQQPKGFAYIEFASADSVANAVELDGTTVHNRAIKVSAKRTNLPGMSATNRVPRGYRARAAAMAAAMYYPPVYRGRGAPRFRSRRAAFYHPYY